ncbi:MAG: Smr/MutS family protein [Thermodesulfobacteriota bacterium]|nr:Smr/MutS family protein [Thermodesulfobacteriota bacterium]
MKSFKASGTYRPFENLKDLLEKKSFPVASDPKEKPVTKKEDNRPLNADEEARLFRELMAGVVPLASDAVHRPEPRPAGPRVDEQDPEAEALALLENLVKEGQGFVVSHTPEYMEGVGYGVNPEIATRLHHGEFSILAHLDLHGLGVEEAHEAFGGFLKEALLTGKRAVLVVHGRGLSSRRKPVLKAKIKEWLTSGPWRKWVIAFTSARTCDGGTGATYILLRQRPATKRHRKRAGKKQVLSKE